MAICAGLLIACAGPRYQMIPTHTADASAGKPIKDVLIIVVVDDEEIRATFENHFKEWLTVKGVEAIASMDVLPVQKGVKLEEQVIRKVIDTYANDSVLITHLVDLEESEVFSRDLPRFHTNYYGFYNYAWGYVTWPTVYGENLKVALETGLYVVSTESLMWAGESRLTNPETPGKAIGQVVEAVIRELERNKLLPNPS
jgi:hypothetical protein